MILSEDSRGCLVVHASQISTAPIVTNDLVRLHSPTSFEWLGRVDRVVNSGGIKCWGEGDNGRLGNYNSSTMESPQSVREISSSTAIGLGENHSCAVLNNNYVVCWGWGASGQLGNNEEYSYNIPVLVRSQ